MKIHEEEWMRRNVTKLSNLDRKKGKKLPDLLKGSK